MEMYLRKTRSKNDQFSSTCQKEMSKTLFVLIFTANRRPVWLIRSSWGWKMNRVVLAGWLVCSKTGPTVFTWSPDTISWSHASFSQTPRYGAHTPLCILCITDFLLLIRKQVSNASCMVLHDMKHIFQGMRNWSLCRASRNKVLFAHLTEQVITVIIDCQSEEQNVILRAIDPVEKLEGGKSGCLSLLWVHITFTRFSFEL